MRKLLIMVLRCRWPPNACDDDSEALCGSLPELSAEVGRWGRVSLGEGKTDDRW